MTKINQAALKREEIATAKARLLELLSPRDTVYTVTRDRNGNQHSVFIVTNYGGHDMKPGILDITHLVAKACGFRKARDGYAITQGGYGYSKAFQIVYSLGSVLWPNGTPDVHGTRNGAPDRAGGYALKQVSM